MTERDTVEFEARPRPLRRSNSDRMVAGVCGGLADFTGLDPVLFRVAIAVATVLGGAGLVAYALAWLIIPEASQDESHASKLLHGRSRGRIALYGVAAIILLCVIGPLVDPFRDDWGGSGFGLVVLLAAGVWLWTRSHRDERLPAPAAPAAPERGTPVVTAADPLPTRMPRRRRRRSKLLVSTLSALLILAGVLSAVGTSGAGHVEPRVALALAVIVVGAGLLVGSIFGSARALIPIGLLLVTATAIATVSEIPLSGGFGERDWRPASVAELSRTYRLTGGDARLDLSALDLGGRSRHVRVAVGMGQLTVLLPAGTPTEIDAHTGMGELRVLGRDESGVDLSRAAFAAGEGPGHLALDLTVGMGQLDVHTSAHLPEVPR